MTALVSIRCDTELDDGTFCIGATVTNGPTTVAGLEASALRRGWSRVGARHYCPTCTARLVGKTPPCLNCGCPWNSCLIHTEFCCDACAHFHPSTTKELTE